MKAIILAAGKGLRLMPFTKNIHKSLLVLRDKPVIREQIENLKEVGIREIAVVVGYKRKQLEKELGNEVAYFFNPFYEITDSVVSLWFAKDFLKDDDVLVMNGDVLADPSIIKDLMKSKHEMCTVVDTDKWNKNGYKVKVKNNFVVGMSMDYSKEESSGEYAGMTKISKRKLGDVVGMLDQYVTEKKFGKWYEDAFVSMIKKGTKMGFVPINKRWWFEIDFPKELKTARKHFRDMKK